MGAVGSIIGSGVLASGFTPLSLPSLWALWDDESNLWSDTAGTTPTTSGGTAARWDDRSGNGRHMLQGTAGNRPLLSVSTQNGRRVVTFASATGAHMSCSPGPTTNLPLFLWAAVRFASLAQCRVLHLDATLIPAIGLNASGQPSNFRNSLEAAITANQWRRLGGVYPNGAAGRVTSNGVDGSAGSADSQSVVTSSVWLGRANWGGDQMDADVLACLACTDIPTAQQLAALDAWAAAKYAI
jgi:hypothetical protein